MTRPAHVFIGLALGAGALALAGGMLLRPRLPLVLGLLALFVFIFAALWAEPRWNSLAALGARPDGGGRFYGVNNQIATLLLSPALVLGALSGSALPGVALLVSAGIGISTIGANGGGLLSFLAGFLALGILQRPTRTSPLRVAVAVAVLAAAALALVGIDAALGGSNHITHAVGGGPGSLAGHFAHRLHLAAAFVAARWNEALLFALSVGGLVWVALRRPRLPVIDALLTAVVVLVLVSDNPTDIVGLGSLSALVLWAWLREEPPSPWSGLTRLAPMRRVAPLLVGIFVLAGCGGGKTVSPTAQTVVGTLPSTTTTQAVAAKDSSTRRPAAALYVEGCSGCHTFAAAGSHSTTGPEPRQSSDYAKQADRARQDFTAQSIKASRGLHPGSGYGTSEAELPGLRR